MTTVIFDIHTSIHFQEVRTALIRIPEVIAQIRMTQDILDKKNIALDLSTYITSDNSTFLHHYRKKELASIVIQLGLFERYLKMFGHPLHCVGVTNSISAVRVISGELSLEQLVEEAFRKAKPTTPPTGEIQELPGMPILTGIQIPRFQSFILNDNNQYEVATRTGAELEKTLQSCESPAEETYEIGLGSSDYKGTVELDPHLRWVWEQVKSSKELLAAN